MGARVDLTGQRFGRWAVLRPAASHDRCTFWLCRCDCGVEREVMTQSLRAGLSLSCGCYAAEIAAEVFADTRTTHGMSGTPEYSVYCGILRRCNNPNDKSFKRYGAKGIECRFSSFEAFFDEVGPRPSDAHTIDRIRSDEHYEAGNVRWATQTEQQRNRSNNLIVRFRGQDKPLAQWCDELDLDYKRSWSRIRQLGWSVDRVLGVAK